LSNGNAYLILDLSELGVDMRLFREEAFLHLGDTSQQMIHIKFAWGGLYEIEMAFDWLLIFVRPERHLVILLVELGAHEVLSESQVQARGLTRRRQWRPRRAE
jgi:mRNA-degrading endonuclease YafQ of YafQ-DinJ toxin-antitoxin module